MNRDHHVDELVGVYALGALSAADHIAVAAHLETCEHCRTLAGELQSLVAVLPLAALPISPSPELKSRLMARVAASPTSTARAEETVTSPPPTLPNRPSGRATVARSGVPARARRWIPAWLPQGTPVFAWAALILVLAFGFWAVLLQAQLADARAQLALLSQPDMRVVRLPIVSAPPSAQAHLFLSPKSSTALLAVNALRPLPGSQVYEFWLIRGSTSVPAGIFNVDAAGAALMRVNSAEPLGTFEKVGLTIERAGGVDTPTLSALVFLGSLD